jgi:hypothetical protein
MENNKIIGYIVNFVDEDRSQFFREFDINTDVNENGRQCVMVFHPNGSVDHHWFLNGKRHREDGPAFESADGTKLWYLNGKPHREDGPAVEYSGGSKHWYLNGKNLTEEEFNSHKA